jgi:DNA-binding transcriptional LysR family regulator
VRLVLSDSVIDLVESHVDVAVRIGRLPDSALVARRVGEIRWVICGSPDYFERRGRPETPDALAEHDCIAFEGLQRYREWPFVEGNALRQVTINPRFSVSTAEGVVAGAIAGVGIARVLSYQAVASIRAGLLLPILADWTPPALPVHLVHAPHQQQPLKLRAFLDFVAPRLQKRVLSIAQDIASAAG